MYYFNNNLNNFISTTTARANMRLPEGFYS